MLIRFSSKTRPHVSMFEKDASLMLAMMNRSGKIPGALAPEDIPKSLQALKHAVNMESDAGGSDADADGDDDSVSLKTRAFPLIELLESAYEHKEHVIWDYDHSVF